MTNDEQPTARLHHNHLPQRKHSMFDPIYSLPLALLPDGTYTKAPLAGAGVLDPLPLGAAYSDVFRKNRAPSSRELVQQLVGTAYACAVLNADLLASTQLRLFLRTRKGESRGKAYLKTV